MKKKQLLRARSIPLYRATSKLEDIDDAKGFPKQQPEGSYEGVSEIDPQLPPQPSLLPPHANKTGLDVRIMDPRKAEELEQGLAAINRNLESYYAKVDHAVKEITAMIHSIAPQQPHAVAQPMQSTQPILHALGVDTGNPADATAGATAATAGATQAQPENLTTIQ